MKTRVAIILILVVGLTGAAWAQLAVFDPANYANAVLRYAELQQQYAQLVTTYQQIRTQYLLLQQQAQLLPLDMNGRYRSLATPWLPFSATNAYGTTAGWIQTANTGHDGAPAALGCDRPAICLDRHGPRDQLGPLFVRFPADLL